MKVPVWAGSALILLGFMTTCNPAAVCYVSDDLDFASMGEEGPPPEGGTIHEVTSINFKMVYVRPGTFRMGSPSEEPGRESDETQHEVTLSKGFYLGVTEVTQGQWKAVMGNNPSHFKNCGDDCPVEQVSWNDVREFIRQLNRKEGTDKYRLPTEAEWEYACRAGSATRYSWGDEASCEKMMYENDVGTKENHCVDYVRSRGLTPDSTEPVKSYKPNAWGFYDMHGNVWEWCEDWYGAYPSGPVIDAKGPPSGAYRVIRGGGWYFTARFCRSANRDLFIQGDRNFALGFRLASDDD